MALAESAPTQNVLTEQELETFAADQGFAPETADDDWRNEELNRKLVFHVTIDGQNTFPEYTPKQFTKLEPLHRAVLIIAHSSKFMKSSEEQTSYLHRVINKGAEPKDVIDDLQLIDVVDEAFMKGAVVFSDQNLLEVAPAAKGIVNPLARSEEGKNDKKILVSPPIDELENEVAVHPGLFPKTTVAILEYIEANTSKDHPEDEYPWLRTDDSNKSLLPELAANLDMSLDNLRRRVSTMHSKKGLIELEAQTSGTKSIVNMRFTKAGVEYLEKWRAQQVEKLELLQEDEVWAVEQMTASCVELATRLGHEEIATDLTAKRDKKHLFEYRYDEFTQEQARITELYDQLKEDLTFEPNLL